jgi:dihydroxyacetone kinase-like predicted kinase
MLKGIAWGLLLIGLAATASADVYRWTDAQGRVHYSDHPESDQAQRVGIVSHSTNPDTVAARTQSEAEQRTKEAAQESQQQADQNASKAVQKDVTKTRADQCKEAKERYRVAIESQKLYRMGKDGERQWLTSQEIDEARVSSKKDMDTVCGEAQAGR